MVAIGVGAALVIGGKKSKAAKKEESDPEPTTPTSSGGQSSPTKKKWRGNRFPLQKWSNGFRVKALQLALVKKQGNVLPKYGADGYWGDELQGALLGAGWPVYYSPETFSQAVGSSSPTNGQISNYHDAAWNLHQAAKKRDWVVASAILQKMGSVADYLAIRTSFISWPFRGTVNFTPVNALFWAFPSRKTEIENHLVRMGLKKLPNGKWSTGGLSGLSAQGSYLQTRRPATIWNHQNLGIKVPAHMLLGRKVKTTGGFVEFVNGNGQHFFVRRSDIRLT